MSLLSEKKYFIWLFFLYFFKNRAIIVFKNLWHIFFRLHSKIGEWAEVPIIQASADKYCLHIFVLFYTNHKDVIRMVAKPVQAERKKYKSIFLNLENNHYTIITKGKKYFFVYINCILLSMLLCIRNANSLGNLSHSVDLLSLVFVCCHPSSDTSIKTVCLLSGIVYAPRLGQNCQIVKLYIILKILFCASTAMRVKLNTWL